MVMIDLCQQAVPESAALQILNSNTLFEEYLRAERACSQFRGGMYWKVQGRYEYLVRTSLDNRQTRLGQRSPATEQVYADFLARKAALAKRLSSLGAALDEAQRLNKAVKAGHVPNLVVSFLNRLRGEGLDQHFTVVGTYALYAYEAVAGVRIVPSAMAAQDLGMLWDVKKRVTFMTDMVDTESRSILHILQRVDASFQPKEKHIETVINSRGFEVNILRKRGEVPFHPGRLSSEENHRPVPAQSLDLLTGVPRFSSPVIALNGIMAMMNTISPSAFVDLGKVLANDKATRLSPEKMRYSQQAKIVQQMLEDGILFDEGTSSSLGLTKN
jgi:hypothetical protein